MSFVWSALLEQTNIVEQAGEIIGATAVYVIEVPRAGGIGNILVEALGDTGIPQPSAPLDQTKYPDVRVELRLPTIVGLRAGGIKVRIVIEYTLQRPEGVVPPPIRGGGSLNQITTQLDRDGNPIELTYKGETVRAEINVPESLQHTSRELVKATNVPDAEVAVWINKVNSDAWLIGLAGQWRCSNVEYEMVDGKSDPKRYRFNYEFERNINGYLVTAAFKDSEGNIPSDLVEGEGIKDIAWHFTRNFGSTFG